MDFKDVIKAVCNQNNSDLYLLVGSITDANADQFIDLIRAEKSEMTTCSLILTTYGGDPDAGFRIARAIKRYYKKFVLYVFGTCKSTGTLIALGADEIIMSDFGEFGPLDIQLTKEDEMYNTSGLSYVQSLNSLTDHIFRSFEHNFLKLKQRSGNAITTRTAAEVASKLAVGLIGPISGQLDPVKVGEVHRAINIAYAYGKRLCGDSEKIRKLASDYPSHGFVIDIDEAKSVFGENVRFVNEIEQYLERWLIKDVRNEYQDRTILLNLHNHRDIMGTVESASDDETITDLVEEPSVTPSENGASTRSKPAPKVGK